MLNLGVRWFYDEQAEGMQPYKTVEPQELEKEEMLGEVAAHRTPRAMQLRAGSACPRAAVAAALGRAALGMAGVLWGGRCWRTTTTTRRSGARR